MRVSEKTFYYAHAYSNIFRVHVSQADFRHVDVAIGADAHIELHGLRGHVFLYIWGGVSSVPGVVVIGRSVSVQ